MPGEASDESHGRDERVNEVLAEYLRRADAGEQIDTEAFIARYPGLETSLREFLDNLRGVNLLVAPAWRPDDRPARLPPGNASAAQGHDADSPCAPDAQDHDHPRQTDRDRPEPIPERIGRFQIERLLGSGGFGTVYLARDTQLDRQVALKVPRAERFPTDQEIERLMEEARAAAQLNHPGLVTIHDVGRDGERVFIVQEYIAGSDLSDRLQRGALPLEGIAELTAQVAEAISYAHQKGFVHRDLKPGNILLDEQGRPCVADFGLAVHETLQRRRKGERSGTPAYMSPEQVRGETHRLDGRSDIWSLGVMLYEMLVGRQPFAGATRLELLDEIEHRDPRPPRQTCPHVPMELERICLKCLSKRAVDRYSSASDMAVDLRHWLAEQRDRQPPVATSTRSGIVPKGLRSFDAEDADFFLDLLPGPRDRDGLPESIRFWKARIESTDAEGSFSVGLIYGPSGCGKSSLIKAGLLPRLAPHVVPVYLEATPEDTELRLLRGLRRRLAAIPSELALPEVLAGIREGLWTPQHIKVCVVLDQFEQWLHAHRGDPETLLVQALRHCDGVRLQCVVLVRDDFWLAASRFSRAVEVEFVPGQNSALVDLFDPLHARKVLAAFGRAYELLPEATALTREQDTFLDRAVAGLAQDGKIICVRLALVADMLKGKPWTTATLSQVGGAEGLGVTFLEETFSSSTAPAAHRHHQRAAQAVLQALLPEAGSDIKGSRQSYEALLDASGYSHRPDDFRDLIQILDSEIRLITPTVPAGEEADTHVGAGAGESAATISQTVSPSEKYYQLTHDYLVPSLRDWLTRKQKETRRGRAELRLAERSALWNAKPENQQLPSWWEDLSIRWLTDHKKWTDPQRRMMRRATRVYGIRSVLVLASLVALGFITILVRTDYARQREAMRIEGLVGRLVSAEPGQVPDIVKELDTNPDVAATHLSPLLTELAETVEARRGRLHARLATVSRDPSLVEPLAEELLAGKITYAVPIRQQLRSSSAKLIGPFRNLLRDEKTESQRRFRAALALADYVPVSDTAGWTAQDLKFVAEQLVSSNAEFQPLLRDALRPIQGKLLANLERIFADPKATDAQRLGAANALADYAVDDVARLTQLLTLATPEQYAELFPLVAAEPAPKTGEALAEVVAASPPDDLGSVERIPFGQRRANAAVTLLRLGEREKVLPVFEWTDDPEALTQFIFRCRPREVGVEPLLDCLQLVSDGENERYPRSSRYALLLALGEFSLDDIPESRRDTLSAQLANWYAHDPSSGVHGAAGWLLRQWGQYDIVRQVDQTEVPYAPDREWFTLAITVTPTLPKPREEPDAEKTGTESEPAQSGEPSESPTGDASDTGASSEPASPAEKPEPARPAEPRPPKTFYYTFVVFPAAEYTIGSVDDEPERQKEEVRHAVKLTRPFALLDREITLEELIAFSPQHEGYMQEYEAKPTDAGFGTDWYDSVGFCRWLGAQMSLTEADQPYAAPESLDVEQYPREPTPEVNWAPHDWPVDVSRRGFRLPTEAEWEVACRACARTAYGYGSEVSLLDRYGWFLENSEKHVHPPKELRPNVRGLFDLHGNLYEWTHDWHGDYGTDGLTDPLRTNGGSSRVYRGGSWYFVAAVCRTARRFTGGPTDRSYDFGFRLALSPSGESSPAEQEREDGAEPVGEGTEGAGKEEDGREK